MAQELCKALSPPYVCVPRLWAITLRDEQSLHVHDHSLIDGGLSHRPISAETRGGRMAAWDKSPRHAEGTLATLQFFKQIAHCERDPVVVISDLSTCFCIWTMSLA